MTVIKISKDSAKDMAGRLREFLREGGHEIKQTHAYAAVAQMLGYRNWNTLSAQLNDVPEEEAHRNAEEVEILWPWVGLARRRERHTDRRLIHQPITWQARAIGKPIVYHWTLPTMMNEPDSFELPIIGEPGKVNGEALLAIFIKAVANLIKAHAHKGLEGVGHEVSRNIWSTEIQYLFRSGEVFSFTIRARGGNDRAEGRALLIKAADQAAEDLHSWCRPILDQYRGTGNPWENLEQYGLWVGEVLRSAKLVPPS